MLGFYIALFFVSCIKYEEHTKMGEILPKSTDKITKLNSQEISKKYLKFIPYQRLHIKVWGLLVGGAQEWVWHHLEKAMAMVKIAQALEPGRLGSKSWLLPHWTCIFWDSVHSPRNNHNNTNFIELLED